MRDNVSNTASSIRRQLGQWSITVQLLLSSHKTTNWYQIGSWITERFSDNDHLPALVVSYCIITIVIINTQIGWFGLRVNGHLALSLHSSTEPGELSQ